MNPERLAITEDQRHETNVKLLLDILERIGLLEHKMTTADQQRVMILSQVAEAMKDLRDVPLIKQRIDQIEPLAKDSEEFRLKFEGGVHVTRSIWIAIGGIVGALITWITSGGHFPSR